MDFVRNRGAVLTPCGETGQFQLSDGFFWVVGAPLMNEGAARTRIDFTTQAVKCFIKGGRKW